MSGVRWLVRRAWQLRWLLLLLSSSCVRSCANVDDPADAAPSPTGCAGDYCQDVETFCQAMVAQCTGFALSQSEALGECRELAQREIGQLVDSTEAGHDLVACGKLPHDNCHTADCVQQVVAHYLPDAGPVPPDAGPGAPLAINAARLVVGDIAECVDCAHSSCSTVAPACFEEGTGASLSDSCYRYRSCLHSCNAGFSDDAERTQCAASVCDKSFPKGRSSFRKYSLCMQANCAQCASRQPDAGAYGAP